MSNPVVKKVVEVGVNQLIVPLYDHQVLAVRGLSSGNYALWHEMGLGKTRSVLTAFRHLQQSGQADTLVVICPKIAKNVWAKEAELVGMEAPAVLSGTKPSGEIEHLAYRKRDRMIVLNYDILPAWLSVLVELGASRRIVVCFDESHFLRNNRIKRYKAAVQLVPFAWRVWQLSGTPMVNGALDLYWQLRLLGPAFPFYYRKHKSFGSMFCNMKFNAFTGNFDYIGIKNEEVLMERCAHIVDRRMKADCLDLPKKLRIPLWLARQEKMGVDYTGNVAESLGTARHELSLKKAKLTIEYLEDALTDRPVVVIGYHHRFMNAVAAHFNAPVIDGNTSENNRIKYMQDFEAGGIPILVGQIQAMGMAITLVKGHHMVFGEVHWSAVDHAQCEDRIHRPGQNSDCTYHYLMVENSVEEIVWKHVLRKGDAIQKLDKAATLSQLAPMFLRD